jgi:hypothetical protein
MAILTKVTFTLDDETVETIRAIAARRGQPRSRVVREAVAAFRRLEAKLDDDERLRRLRVLDDLTAAPPTRSRHEVDEELRDLRRTRRTGWRRASD